jgi:hypothetical protein
MSRSWRAPKTSNREDSLPIYVLSMAQRRGQEGMPRLTRMTRSTTRQVVVRHMDGFES